MIMPTRYFTFKFLCVVLFSLLLLISSAFAISDAAVLSLLISPSAKANAMGQTYGNISSTAPLAVMFNPASLGFFAQGNIIGTFFYSEKNIEWLHYNNSNSKYKAKSICIGMNLNSIIDFPLSVGLARYSAKMNLGTMSNTDISEITTNYFEGSEKYTGTSISIAMEYLLNISLGFTLKKYDTKLAQSTLPESGLIPLKADDNAYDMGMLVEIPFIEIAQKSGLFKNVRYKKFRPFLKTGYYYSLPNIGDKTTYSEIEASDPLPRNLSLGINLNTGLFYKTTFGDIHVFQFKWAREVDDLLVEYSDDGRSKYVSGPHDIQFWDHVILGKSNSKIISKKGYELNFFDFYFLRKGKYNDSKGEVILDTAGWGVNYMQPVRLALELLKLENNFWVRLISHTNIEQHYSRYEQAGSNSQLDKTEFKNIVIRVQHFPLH